MDSVDDILAHYGVKGMKWGRRKGESGPSDVVLKETPGKKIKTSGGTGQAASDDARKAAAARQKAKASSIDALSNQELQLVVQRMNLERQYNSLKVDRASPAAKFVTKLLVDAGQQQVRGLVNEKANQVAKKAKKD